MAITTRAIVLGPTDAAGAFGPITVTCPGAIRGVGVKVGTLAATVDITIADGETGVTLLTLTNVAANALVQPVLTAVDSAGAATNPVVSVAPALSGKVKVTVAGGGDTKTGTLLLVLER